MIVLVEVYLRLENRLMSSNVDHHEHHPLVSSDDSVNNRIVVNLTKVRNILSIKLNLLSSQEVY